ncbi:MAG TPA: IS110 family transposase [Isosphaeraceae bacterium]|nr:IS110 family transposase [Isosphaeraceae bacterium]
METLFPRCAGLDVHKADVVACLRTIGPGGGPTRQVRTFSTMTRSLRELADWLSAGAVTHVAMESTGVSWKPVFNILEDQFTVWLVNAAHIKQVPGRKTDVKDREWIAQLLQHGLLRPSFVPPRPVRERRDLTRPRARLVSDKTSVANRIAKVLEDANIKLGAVATDILGVSGRLMIDALIGGQEDPAVMASMARGRLRKKVPALEQALDGAVSEPHRDQLRRLRDQLHSLEGLIDRLDERIVERMDRPTLAAIGRLRTIPGIERGTAEVLVAELGTDMSVFPTAAHLSSWAGICPGHNRSGGKARSGRTTKGDRWLRRALTQAAWAASPTKETYLSAQYRRLAARRGKKRAPVAVGHTILVIAYHVLKDRTSYRELGAEYRDRLEPERQTRQLVRRLEKLGHKVTLEPRQEVA